MVVSSYCHLELGARWEDFNLPLQARIVVEVDNLGCKVYPRTTTKVDQLTVPVAGARVANLCDLSAAHVFHLFEGRLSLCVLKWHVHLLMQHHRQRVAECCAS